MTHKPDSAALIGTSIGGRYVLERLLGEGGMGAVFAARELEGSQRVALKIIHGELFAGKREHVDRFLQETLAAALVTHPNVVRSLGAFSDQDGRPVLVLELLEGTSLDRIIRRGPLPIEQSVDIAIQASLGIAAAHAKGVIHRDLKPGNVFLARDERGVTAKVLDFGVALLHDPLRDPTEARRTDHSVLLGTLDYMSPEQLQDARVADERSDVYALGVILFEMLTGSAPFTAPTDPMLAVEILNKQPADLVALRPEVPAALVRIVERALAKSPADRFQSMEELAAALRAFAERPSQQLRAGGERSRPTRQLVGWIVLGIVLAIAVSALLLR